MCPEHARSTQTKVCVMLQLHSVCCHCVPAVRVFILRSLGQEADQSSCSESGTLSVFTTLSYQHRRCSLQCSQFIRNVHLPKSSFDFVRTGTSPQNMHGHDGGDDNYKDTVTAIAVLICYCLMLLTSVALVAPLVGAETGSSLIWLNG